MSRLSELHPSFCKTDRDRMLAAMGMTREGVAGCLSVELPNSIRAQKCQAVLASLDALALDITGDPTFFEGDNAPPKLLIRT